VSVGWASLPAESSHRPEACDWMASKSVGQASRLSMTRELFCSRYRIWLEVQEWPWLWPSVPREYMAERIYKGGASKEARASTMLMNRYGLATALSLERLKERYAYVDLDEWIVIPNHVHAIILIDAGLVGAVREPPAEVERRK